MRHIVTLSSTVLLLAVLCQGSILPSHPSGQAFGPSIFISDLGPNVHTEPAPDASGSKQVIESFHVQTDIRYRFATTKMCSIVRNAAGTAHEMTFGMTLPKDAFIISFAMTIDGKVYDGEVKEKTAAREQYNRAVEQGQSAGHIRQTPRHSNRFDMSVNVANGTAVNFTLVYQQILSRRLGVYEYEMHVEPGQAVEDFNVEVFIQENRPLQFVKTPQLRKVSISRNTIEAANDLTTVDRPTETTAHVQYKPTVGQQGDGGLSARFVVQYDVEHSENGDILVADGYFIHLFSPKPRKPLPKDIVFVLDVSGSMAGQKIVQLKDAMTAILDDLTENDRFNILTFSNEAHKWKSVLTPVTSEVVNEAKGFVATMNPRGGTNINEALLTALDELQGREVYTRVGMVFFLTDGQATVGQSNPTVIAQNVKNKNKHESFVYSLAFGQGANFESLKTISTQNNGYARKIYEASDAALQVELLYDEISTVAMKNVSVKYLPSVNKTTQTIFPIVQNGTEIVIGGCIDLRWLRRNKEFLLMNSDFKAQIEGTEKDGEVDILLEVDDIDDITIDPDDSLNSFFTMPRDYSGIVEKMWAFLTIKQMLRDKQGVIELKNKTDELDKKILEMSLKYKFVTPLTSMVVTKPDEESPVESGLEDADTPRPQYMDQSARRGQVANHPMYASVPRTPMSGRVHAHPSSNSNFRRHYSQMGLPGIAESGKRRGYVNRSSVVPLKRVQPPNPKRDSRNRKNRNGGKRTRSKGKKTTQFGVLRYIVFNIDHQPSFCLQPKKIPAGKYLLAEVDGAVSTVSNFKAELETICKKNCRFVVPVSLVLTSNGRSISINMTSLDSWNYHQHPDFDVTFVKMNKVVFSHSAATVTIERTKQGKKTFFYIFIEIKPNTIKSSSDMTTFAMLSKRGKRQKRRRTPKACQNNNSDLAMYLGKKRALKYKIN